MKSGWHQNIHYNIFTEEEALCFYTKYNIDNYIPEYRLIGLIGWDDFIISKNNEFYKIPTVPIDLKYCEKLPILDLSIKLTEDSRIKNLIKWYIKPIVFGGNPEAQDNVEFIDIEKHCQYVNFWNKKYFEIKNGL